MLRLYIAVALLYLASCMAPNRLISYNIPTVSLVTIDPPPQKIIILNSYNIAAKKVRNNKEELFITLVDSLMQLAAEKIYTKTNIATQAIKGYTPTGSNTDSSVYAIMLNNQASHAITINSFDVYFYQTQTDVTKNPDGTKSRSSSYDIVSAIDYSLYGKDTLLKKMEVNKSMFHSKRAVFSGLLAAGPNVVAQHNDAWNIATENLKVYLNNFFPGEKQVSRVLFTQKEFDAVGKAIIRNDYDAAMTESLRLINHPDKGIAARANYNCAVLAERKNLRDEARKYLRQSLALTELFVARNMLSQMNN